MELKRLSRILMRTAAVLLVLVMLSTSMIAGRYARYVTTATFEDSARVARFNIIEELNEEKLFTDVGARVQPGMTTLEGITIKNYSEVMVDFTITVTSPFDNLPLSFEMKDGETELKKTVSANGVITFIGRIGPNQQEKAFKLFISWPIEENSPQYSGKVDVIRISVNAIQVD